MATYLAPGVYVEEFDSGPVPIAGLATAVAAFVGFTAIIPHKDDKPAEELDYSPRLVTSWAQYKRAYGGFGLGDWKLGHRALLPASVFGFFNNGGTTAYIVPLKWTENRDKDNPALELPSTDYYVDEDLNKALGLENKPDAEQVKGIPAAKDPATPVLTVRRGPGTEGELAVAVEKHPDDGFFALRVRQNGAQVLHVEKAAVGKAADAVKAAIAKTGEDGADPRLKLKPDFISVEDIDSVMPRLGRYALTYPEPFPREVLTTEIQGAQEGEDGPKGLDGLKIHDDVTMLLFPDLYNVARYKAINDAEEGDARDAVTSDWRTVDLPIWKDIQTMMIMHCDNEDNRMAILDPPPSEWKVDKIKAWRNEDAMYDSMHAAMYYPWLEVSDPVESGERMFVPPGGHMAGIWAKTDSTRGVWKAPANEVVAGAVGVQHKITSVDQEQLNPYGINAIRPFGTRGIRVWGARTLSSNMNWNYINVRRLFSTIEKSVMNGTQWVVFEPNDQTTWDRVNRTVSNYLTGLWRDGALFGATPDQAFYVTCDESNNPPDSRDLGKLICEVGISPVKPAEFVIFRVTQWKPE